MVFQFDPEKKVDVRREVLMSGRTVDGRELSQDFVRDVFKNTVEYVTNISSVPFLPLTLGHWTWETPSSGMVGNFELIEESHPFSNEPASIIIADTQMFGEIAGQYTLGLIPCISPRILEDISTASDTIIGPLMSAVALLGTEMPAIPYLRIVEDQASQEELNLQKICRDWQIEGTKIFIFPFDNIPQNESQVANFAAQARKGVKPMAWFGEKKDKPSDPKSTEFASKEDVAEINKKLDALIAGIAAGKTDDSPDEPENPGTPENPDNPDSPDNTDSSSDDPDSGDGEFSALVKKSVDKQINAAFEDLRKKSKIAPDGKKDFQALCWEEYAKSESISKTSQLYGDGPDIASPLGGSTDLKGKDEGVLDFEAMGEQLKLIGIPDAEHAKVIKHAKEIGYEGYFKDKG